MDDKTFYSAFNHTAGLLQKSAHNFAGNMEDARALYQETAFQISRHKKTAADSGSFKKWAVDVMRNIFQNSLRRKKPSVSQAALQKSAQHSPIELENIMEKVELLEEDYRVPFWNHFMGLSEQEIAEHTGLPVETVRERIAAARQQLNLAFREAAKGGVVQ